VPNTTAQERFVRSIKEECLDRIIPMGISDGMCTSSLRIIIASAIIKDWGNELFDRVDRTQTTRGAAARRSPE
jgi:hypothetical protein